MSTFSRGPVKVSQSGKQIGKRCAVVYVPPEGIWGTLHVWWTPQRHQAYRTTAPKESKPQVWQVKTDEGQMIEFTSKGCSS